MSGATKLMTSGGGGLLLTPASNIASDVTVNIPSRAGNLAIDGPAFSAYSTVGVSCANTTFTKQTYDVEVFDTNNNFASSRFTPTVAGYYQINAGTVFGVVASGICFIDIYKNGAEFARGSLTFFTSGINPSCVVSSVIYFNGSTDYVEIYVYQNSGGSLSTFGGQPFQYFNGCLVRSA